MARGVFSSANYFRASTSLITATPLTMACWMNPSAITNAQWCVGVIYTGGAAAQVDGWQLSTVASTGLARASVYDGAGGSSGVNSSTGAKAGIFNHIAAVFGSSTSRYAYMNGVAGSEGTASRAPGTASDTFMIGDIRLA